MPELWAVCGLRLRKYDGMVSGVISREDDKLLHHISVAGQVTSKMLLSAMSSRNKQISLAGETPSVRLFFVC